MEASLQKRKSRLVKIPTKIPLSLVIGMPPILFSDIRAKASATFAVGLSVIGSVIKPLSERFTLRTSAACASIGIFLCNTPIPPSRASAIARLDSVTVSIAADNIGILIVILRVTFVRMSVSLGKTCE